MIATTEQKHGKDVVVITLYAFRALEAYDFPGNVRELKNVIERAVTLAGARTIGARDIPSEIFS